MEKRVATENENESARAWAVRELRERADGDQSENRATEDALPILSEKAEREGSAPLSEKKGGRVWRLTREKKEPQEKENLRTS